LSKFKGNLCHITQSSSGCFKIERLSIFFSSNVKNIMVFRYIGPLFDFCQLRAGFS